MRFSNVCALQHHDRLFACLYNVTIYIVYHMIQITRRNDKDWYLEIVMKILSNGCRQVWKYTWEPPGLTYLGYLQYHVSQYIVWIACCRTSHTIVYCRLSHFTLHNTSMFRNEIQLTLGLFAAAYINASGMIIRWQSLLHPSHYSE